MLFGSDRAEALMRILDAAGYRRLLDVPAVPAVNPAGLRYDVRVPVLPGPTDWYLRSFGVRFDLVSRRWHRHARRWYSIGWGVVEERQVSELLLVQSYGRAPDGAAAELTAIRRLAHRYVAATDADGCVRAAAVLDRPPGDPDG